MSEDPAKWEANDAKFLIPITNFVKKSEPALKKEI